MLVGCGGEKEVCHERHKCKQLMFEAWGVVWRYDSSCLKTSVLREGPSLSLSLSLSLIVLLPLDRSLVKGLKIVDAVDRCLVSLHVAFARFCGIEAKLLKSHIMWIAISILYRAKIKMWKEIVFRSARAMS